jgi:endoglycosylceramidase
MRSREDRRDRAPFGGATVWLARGFVGAAAILACGCSSTADSRDAGPPPSGPALPVGPVGHHGRWLTDAEGRVLLIHGVNVVQKDAPYYPASAGFSDADAAWLADNGFRVVRVGILATGLMPTPGVVDTHYIEKVAETVADLAKHDVFSLIDFHQDGWGPEVGSDGFPAWMTLTGNAVNDTSAGFPLYYQKNPALQQAFQSFWDDAKGPDGHRLQDDYAAMFGAVAKQFAGDPHVLGYDLFNEPWPGTTWSDCLNKAGGCPSLDKSELAPAYAKAVAAIRAAGDEHLIFGEPFVLFNFGYTPTAIPLPGGDANAGLSFHDYPILQTYVPKVIENAVAWSSRTGGALLNTEWGATTDGATLTDDAAAFDAALVPWIFWSFYSEVVPSLEEAPGGKNLVESTAKALIEPHPLAVAGVPQELVVDQARRTLLFTWTTSRADGGEFAKDAVTSFAVPAFTYPDGYTATATNGWITSAPCAPILTVAAKPGAAAVTVTVEPRGECK